MRDHVLLYLNGRPVRVAGDDVFLTLSDYLRRRQGLVGTKVVCAEGDCGSCSVLVGRVTDGRLRYASLCSCIQLVFQLDGAHVVSVEGLKDGGQLNPIQEAMVACQGSQCGFCTPGFVVALYDLMHEGRPCDANAVTRGLVGNLCRCTGYSSIVRAALETDRTTLKSLDQLYPPDAIASQLQAAEREPVRIESGARRFFKPTSIEDAVRFKSENPGCLIVSGATDLGVQYNKGVRELTVVMSTSGLTALRGIRVDASSMHVGATATLTELERVSAERLPELSQFLAWFGSPLIKNSGTLAGNLVNASPIGDTLPALMVLNADVELAGTAGRRRINMNDFYTGYRKTVLAPDELVVAVHIPLPRPGELFKLYKVSRRKDLDISTFGAAVWMRAAGGTIEDVRIAYGGVGPVVLRLPKTESHLRGGPATLDRFEAAGQIALDEITPITDVRGADTYRRQLAANVLQRFWHETLGDAASDTNGDSNGHPAPPAPLHRAGVSTALHPRKD
jgi:xanthine dehydrogenase small subunit